MKLRIELLIALPNKIDLYKAFRMFKPLEDVPAKDWFQDKSFKKTSYGIFIGPLDDPLYTPAVYAYVD